jgi:RNA polymerase sigma-70 factor (ECF subfamily)
MTADVATQPEQLLMQDERRSEFLAAINSLGEKHRLVVILRYYAGFSNEEIAQTLGIPSGTVRSRLHTARQRLKVLLVNTGETTGQQIMSNRVAL